MTKIKNTFLFILVLMTAISCGRPVEKSKVRIATGFVTGSSQFPGGLMILGHSDNNDHFSLRVPNSDVLELELNNGTWKFVVFGWDSATEHYEGSNYCDAISNLQLTGGDFDLNLEATQAKCSTISEADSMTGLNFVPLRFNSCLNIQSYIYAGDTIPVDMVCDGSNGDPMDGGAQSFRIEFIERTPEGNILGGYPSACVLDNGNNSAGVMKLPYGNANLNIPYKVKAYAGSACTGAVTEYNFAKGFKNPALGSLAAAVVDANTEIEIYVHNDACVGGQLIAHPFAASSGNHHLICSADQFVKMVQYGGSFHTFELGIDINFSQLASPAGTFAYVADNFGGQLKGAGHKLINGDRALFNRIISQPTNSDDTFIHDLKIENFNIAFSSSSNSSFGIFANEVYNGGWNDIEVSSIEIDNLSQINISGNNTGQTGGLVGFAWGYSNYTFIRNVSTAANVYYTGSDPTHALGGLVGKTFGPNNTTFQNRNLAIESVVVGEYQDNTGNPVPHTITMNGHHGVGGLVGVSYNTEYRGSNVARTTIFAQQGVGGAIGQLGTNNNGYSNVGGIYAEFEFVPEVANTEKVGGIIGDIPNSSSNDTFQIYHVVADTVINANANHVSRLGGIVGNHNSTGHNNLVIANVRSFIDSEVNGSEQGGFIGRSYSNSVQLGFNLGELSIAASVAQGELKQFNDNAFNYRRGGFAGYARDLGVIRSIADFPTIEGRNYLSGGIGDMNDSFIYESSIFAQIFSDNPSSYSTFLGGAAGYIYTGTDTNTIQIFGTKVDVNIDLNVANPNSNYEASMGLLFGEFGGTLNTSISFDSLADGTAGRIQRADASDMTFHCGRYQGGACPAIGSTGTFGGPAGLDDTDVDCAGVTGAWTDSPGVCVPLFENAWYNYGWDAGSGIYRAGNTIEPFIINTVGDWDGLSDDSFLMSKSYRLTNHIDFGNGAPNAIGSLMEPFSGSLISDGYELRNINFTASASKPGIISYVKDGASIGGYHKNLVVRDAIINCGTESSCGFIGEIVNPGSSGSFGSGDAEIRVEMLNAEVNGSGDCQGGIIGKSLNRFRMRDSGFNGKFNTSGDGIGALLGCLGDSSSAFMSFGGDIRVDIEDSYVDAERIIGNDYVGGMIGRVYDKSSSQTFIGIENSYVVLDKNQVNGTLDIETTGGVYTGGIIGGADFTNLEFDMKTVYVDTSNAQVETADYHHFARSYAGSLDGNDDFEDLAVVWNNADGSPTGASFMNTIGSSNVTFIETSIQNLVNNSSADSFQEDQGGGDNGKWIINNGVLKHEWQVNGFDDY